jgi:hypothetical protein
MLKWVIAFIVFVVYSIVMFWFGAGYGRQDAADYYTSKYGSDAQREWIRNRRILEQTIEDNARKHIEVMKALDTHRATSDDACSTTAPSA